MEENPCTNTERKWQHPNVTGVRYNTVQYIARPLKCSATGYVWVHALATLGRRLNSRFDARDSYLV